MSLISLICENAISNNVHSTKQTFTIIADISFWAYRRVVLLSACIDILSNFISKEKFPSNMSKRSTWTNMSVSMSTTHTNTHTHTIFFLTSIFVYFVGLFSMLPFHLSCRFGARSSAKLSSFYVSSFLSTY